MGLVLADHSHRSDERDGRTRPRCREARVRCEDADEKDRHRDNRGGAARLTAQFARFGSGAPEVLCTSLNSTLERSMAKYLIHGSYTVDGVRGLLKESGSKRRAAGPTP